LVTLSLFLLKAEALIFGRPDHRAAPALGLLFLARLLGMTPGDCPESYLS